MTFSLKEKIRSGRSVRGVMTFAASAAIVEVIGYAGFDFVIIDTEHTPVGYGAELAGLVRAAAGANLSALVRVKSARDPAIQAALELGAEGVIVPHVTGVGEARDAVASAKFPPAGQRGYAGLVRAGGFGLQGSPEEFVARSNSQTIVLLMAEDESFLDNMDAILAVPGVDGAFVGSADYAVSLGLPPRGPQAAAAVKAAKQRLEPALREKGLLTLASFMNGTREDLSTAAAAGYHFISICNDVAAFGTHCQGLLDPEKAR